MAKKSMRSSKRTQIEKDTIKCERLSASVAYAMAYALKPEQSEQQLIFCCALLFTVKCRCKRNTAINLYFVNASEHT